MAASVTAEEAQQDAPADNLEFVPARRCTCTTGSVVYKNTDYYCPLPWTHCGIPEWGIPSIDHTPGCLNLNEHHQFVRTVFWPALLVCCFLLLIYSCLSKPGRGVFHYILGKLVSGWNRWQVDRMMVHDPARSSLLIRRYCERRRREMALQYLQNGAGESQRNLPVDPVLLVDDADQLSARPPTALALKTRIFRAQANKNDETDHEEVGSDFGDEDDTCTICFGPLVDGCRVGALPCDHVFHVDCLKTWLKRRNVCPLCQTPHVATLTYGQMSRRDEGRTEEETTGAESSSRRVVPSTEAADQTSNNMRPHND